MSDLGKPGPAGLDRGGGSLHGENACESELRAREIGAPSPRAPDGGPIAKNKFCTSSYFEKRDEILVAKSDPEKNHAHDPHASCHLL